MGRPTSLDDLVAQRIISATEVGAPRYMAAAAGGISKQTLKNWRHRAAAGEEPFVALFARLEKAEAAGAVAALDCIKEAAAKGTWQAAAWLLERRYPKQFALRRPETALPAVTPEEAEKIIADIKALP